MSFCSQQIACFPPHDHGGSLGTPEFHSRFVGWINGKVCIVYVLFRLDRSSFQLHITDIVGEISVRPLRGSGLSMVHDTYCFQKSIVAPVQHAVMRGDGSAHRGVTLDPDGL